jgi:uncharacterized membrane protein
MQSAKDDLRESHVRSLLKAISYRIIGTLTTTGLTFMVTGSARAALTMGAVEPIAKILIYYFHERIWQWAPRGTIRSLFHRNR